MNNASHIDKRILRYIASSSFGKSDASADFLTIQAQITLGKREEAQSITEASFSRVEL